MSNQVEQELTPDITSAANLIYGFLNNYLKSSFDRKKLDKAKDSPVLLLELFEQTSSQIKWMLDKIDDYQKKNTGAQIPKEWANDYVNATEFQNTCSQKIIDAGNHIKGRFAEKVIKSRVISVSDTIDSDTVREETKNEITMEVIWSEWKKTFPETRFVHREQWGLDMISSNPEIRALMDSKMDEMLSKVPVNSPEYKSIKYFMAVLFRSLPFKMKLDRASKIITKLLSAKGHFPDNKDSVNYVCNCLIRELSTIRARNKFVLLNEIALGESNTIFDYFYTEPDILLKQTELNEIIHFYNDVINDKQSFKTKEGYGNTFSLFRTTTYGTFNGVPSAQKHLETTTFIEYKKDEENYKELSAAITLFTLITELGLLENRQDVFKNEFLPKLFAHYDDVAENPMLKLAWEHADTRVERTEGRKAFDYISKGETDMELALKRLR